MGSGGNKKLLPRSFSTVDTTRILQASTQQQQLHKHHHHGGAICPFYGVVSMDTPNRTRVTYSNGVGQERLGLD